MNVEAVIAEDEVVDTEATVEETPAPPPAKPSKAAKAEQPEATDEETPPPPAKPPKAAKAEQPEPPDPKNWYIVKVQSGREESIKEAIERRVKIEGLDDYFGQLMIPVERETVLVKSKRVVKTRKMYPGYVFAKVEFNDRILYLFRETSGVGDFVGAGPNRAPLPMPEHEIEKMLISQLPAEQAREQIKVHIGFEKGDRVRVRDGTFAGMEGEVKEITEPKDAKEPPRVRVELTIFGRPVPVEVEAWQVEAP